MGLLCPEGPRFPRAYWQDSPTAAPGALARRGSSVRWAARSPGAGSDLCQLRLVCRMLWAGTGELAPQTPLHAGTGQVVRATPGLVP